MVILAYGQPLFISCIDYLRCTTIHDQICSTNPKIKSNFKYLAFTFLPKKSLQNIGRGGWTKHCFRTGIGKASIYAEEEEKTVTTLRMG